MSLSMRKPAEMGCWILADMESPRVKVRNIAKNCLNLEKLLVDLFEIPLLSIFSRDIARFVGSVVGFRFLNRVIDIDAVFELTDTLVSLQELWSIVELPLVGLSAKRPNKKLLFYQKRKARSEFRKVAFSAVLPIVIGLVGLLLMIQTQTKGYKQGLDFENSTVVTL